MKVKEVCLYTYNGVVVSTNPGWLQTAFDKLTRLINRVRLQKHVRKLWV